MKIRAALAFALLAGLGTGANADSHRPVRASDIAPQAIEPALSSSQIIVMVRGIGFDPVTRPVQRGATYVLRAIDPNDADVHMVVDARTGRVLSVNPTVVAPPRLGGRYEPSGP